MDQAAVDARDDSLVIRVTPAIAGPRRADSARVHAGAARELVAAGIRARPPLPTVNVAYADNWSNPGRQDSIRVVHDGRMWAVDVVLHMNIDDCDLYFQETPPPEPAI